MPTLEAASRYDNILKSIVAFSESAIKTALGITVFYFYTDPEEQFMPARWIELEVIPAGPIGVSMPMGAGSISTLHECYININCFENAESGLAQVNIFTLASLVDDVRALFEVGAAIPIYDYQVSGYPRVGALSSWENPRINPVVTPESSGIRQINVSAPMRFYSITT